MAYGRSLNASMVGRSDSPVAQTRRAMAAALLVLAPCLLMGGCLSHAPRRDGPHHIRREAPPNRRLAITARPERRVSHSRREE